MTLLLQYMLMFASVLLLVALGGCFSEHSGVINIGLEGIMVFGALGGALMMKYMPDGTAVVVVILLTTLMAMIFGMLYSLLLAVAAINFKADQTLVGTAMNLLGTAAATVIVHGIRIRSGRSSSASIAASAGTIAIPSYTHSNRNRGTLPNGALPPQWRSRNAPVSPASHAAHSAIHAATRGSPTASTAAAHTKPAAGERIRHIFFKSNPPLIIRRNAALCDPSGRAQDPD